MKILGVDPGGTTGLCLVHVDVEDKATQVVVSEEVPLKELTPTVLDYYLMFDDLTAVVFESIVSTGALTEGKINQIRAAERVLFEAEVYEKDKALAFITPEARKKIKEVPPEVHGDHARDAFRVVRAFINRLWTQ